MSQCIQHSQSRARGYGTTTKDGKAVYLHRVAYCSANACTLADIQDQQVRHTCDNPRCVNPEHLVLGTHTDNMQDKVTRSRTGSKLQDCDVIAMRSAYGAECTLSMLAVRYGISEASVSWIINRKTWSHVKT